VTCVFRPKQVLESLEGKPMVLVEALKCARVSFLIKRVERSQKRKSFRYGNKKSKD
jgi:hypothetical protein